MLVLFWALVPTVALEVFHVHLQVACDDGAEKSERGFILQLLESSSSTNNGEVLLKVCIFIVFA